jgi:hypothetical protein
MAIFNSYVKLPEGSPNGCSENPHFQNFPRTSPQLRCGQSSTLPSLESLVSTSVTMRITMECYGDITLYNTIYIRIINYGYIMIYIYIYISWKTISYYGRLDYGYKSICIYIHIYIIWIVYYEYVS